MDWKRLWYSLGFSFVLGYAVYFLVAFQSRSSLSGLAVSSLGGSLISVVVLTLPIYFLLYRLKGGRDFRVFYEVPLIALVISGIIFLILLAIAGGRQPHGSAFMVMSSIAIGGMILVVAFSISLLAYIFADYLKRVLVIISVVLLLLVLAQIILFGV